MATIADPPCVECDRLGHELRAAWHVITEAVSTDSSTDVASAVLAELHGALAYRRAVVLEMAIHQGETGHEL